MRLILLTTLFVLNCFLLFGQVRSGKIMFGCDGHLLDGLINSSTPVVEFDFNVSQFVDENNANGDSPYDGVEAASSMVPGPAVGPVSTGIVPTINSNGLLNQMVYNLFEVDCETGLNIQHILTDSITLNSQVQPEYYSFANFILTPETDPYFINPDNFLDKCFKVEVIGTNDCGMATDYSYFTVVPDLIMGTETQLKKIDILLFPNPVVNQLFFELSTDFELKQIQILDLNGCVVLSTLSYIRDNRIDVSGLEKGIYFLKFEGQETTPIRFVKL